MFTEGQNVKICLEEEILEEKKTYILYVAAAQVASAVVTQWGSWVFCWTHRC